LLLVLSCCAIRLKCLQMIELALTPHSGGRLPGPSPAPQERGTEGWVRVNHSANR